MSDDGGGAASGRNHAADTLRRLRLPRDGAPIRKAVPVAVSSDLCVVGASETDVAVPLNSPKTPLQTSSTTLFTPSSSGSPAPTADPAPPSPVWARSWRGFNTVDE